jgi:hypothetical protein
MIQVGEWLDWMARYSLLTGDYCDSTDQHLVVSEACTIFLLSRLCHLKIMKLFGDSGFLSA